MFSEESLIDSLGKFALWSVFNMKIGSVKISEIDETIAGK